MPRPHRLPRPVTLLALVAGLAAGACGGTLYDADGVPRLDPNGCGSGTHLCGTECVPQDAAACGANCDPCTTQVPDAAPACLPSGAGGDYGCGITCVNDTRLCGSQCLAQTAAACGASCRVCPAPPTNGAATCLNPGGTYDCDYTCNPGFFKAGAADAPRCGQPAAVAAGERHTCAVAEGGALLCWGANGSSQLGPLGGGAASAVPRLVYTGQVWASAGGGRHTCAIVGADRHVECWGANEAGQLGRGAPSATPIAAPGRVEGALTDVFQLAAGSLHTCALTGAGAVRCWGANASGQSGTSTISTLVAQPGAAAIAAGATAIAAGGGTTCAAAPGGVLRCWGFNTSGQVGGGGTGAALAPTSVTGLPAGGSVISLAVGATHACALITGAADTGGVNGQGLNGLWCWGADDQWQLGDGGLASPLSATPIQGGSLDQRSRMYGVLAAGGAHTCAWRVANNSIECGGRADELQVGVPVPLAANVDRNELPSGGPVLQLTAGAAHTCALVADATAGPQVKCWGRNAEGQLGRPTAGGAPDGGAAVVPP